ncbi:MAG: hypothetical protein JWP91_1533 [Fibrobacteres bacterium]|nr:hypothetical protein [Fibrobacterota bacterium]
MFPRLFLILILGLGAAARAAAPEFLANLYRLCDGLAATQNLKAGDKDFGALVCPSTNPDNHPTHSRGAEAVYPLAVAFKHGKDARYADAAVKLGNWLIRIQNAAGAWGEDWPNHDGWDGTTADQLISLAGAYVMLKDRLTTAENNAWTGSIKRSADWIEANFPKGNLNYLPTGAVALKLASIAIPGAPAKWNAKAAALMAQTVQSVNSQDFITGEGMGIDLGYNIAQSIGYIALYGILTNTAADVDFAARVLRTHFKFMYPNGAIDNSWGTRSYKWMLESGSKTAPGIPFTFALLADKDPAFNRAATLSLDFLSRNFIGDGNLMVYGPHSAKHAGSNPPCIYPSFARAQSLATAVEYGPDAAASAPIPSEAANWYQYFSTAKTALIRTEKIMATLTAYDAIGQYSRGEVVRGGSITNLWFEGYGTLGFLQTSSQTAYNREEPRHMPVEGSLLPLTPRIDKPGAVYYANLYDEKAVLAAAAEGDGYKTTSTGSLRDSNGASSGVGFTWIHRFLKGSYSSEVTVTSPQGVRIVEPFVDNPGNLYALGGDSLFRITTAEGGVWELRVLSSTGPFTLASGEDKAKYWSPFPGLECHPLTIKLGGTGGQTIKYAISQSKPTRISSETRMRRMESLRAWRSGRAEIAYAYTLAMPADPRIRLRAFDGRIVREVILGRLPAGPHQGGFDISRQSPGTYFLELIVGGRVERGGKLAWF